MRRAALPALLAAALLVAPAWAQGRGKAPTATPARFVAMGDAAAGRGEFDQALILYDRAIELDSRNAAALKSAGSAALARGNGPRAFGYFAAWAAQSKDNPEALLGMGAALVLRQDPQEALTVLARALDLKAPLREVARWEGIALSLLGRAQDAQLSFSHALGSAPDDPDIIENFALSLAITGDRAAALQLLDKLGGDPPGQGPDLRRTRAFVHALTGDLRQASASLAGMPAADRERLTALLVRIPELNEPERALVAYLGRLPASKLIAPPPPPTVAASEPVVEEPAERPAPLTPAELAAAPRIWVQLAASPDRPKLAALWTRIRNQPALAGRSAQLQRAPAVLRLLAGPFPSERAAMNAIATLKRAGIDAIIARTPKGADISPL